MAEVDAAQGISTKDKVYRSRPLGLRWRSHTGFILSTVGMSLFTDMFLYGLAVPILPFILEDRIYVPDDRIQTHVSWLIAAYAVASVLFSPIAGIVADKTSSRQLPFLVGLAALMASTVLLFVGRTVWILAIARLLQGASGAVVWTVGLALCVDTVGQKNLGKAIGTIFSFISFGGLVSPVLGGVLYKKSGLESVAALAMALLFVDFLMRALVIEKKVAARYRAVIDAIHQANQTDEPSQAQTLSQAPASDTTPLIPPEDPAPDPSYIIKDPENQPYLIRRLPIFYTFHSPSLALAISIGLAQALVAGAFDATVPLQSRDLFDFDSLKAGLLFAPLGIADLIVGPIGGWAVDRFGTKIIAVIGYGLLAPVLVALRLPNGNAPHGSDAELRQIILYACLLGAAGVGFSLTGSPSLVEASSEVERYEKANPGFFGEGGPYAQLYGLNSMFFCLGLSVGPVLAGTLREKIGYGDMSAVLAVVCVTTSLACFRWLGGPPKAFWKKSRSKSVDGDL